MGFPKRNIQAIVKILRDKEFFSAYLILWDNLVYTYNSNDTWGTFNYVPGEARQVEFKDLPETVQKKFMIKLTENDLNENSRGLSKLPEYYEEARINGFTIFRKRQRMRKNNYKIEHEGKEVWIGNSRAEADEFLKNSVSNT